MPAIRVDFYLLNDDKTQGHLLLACRLLEKAYMQGHHAFVYCNDKQSAEKLDELLWTFKDNSFIPHNLPDGRSELLPPIRIGYGTVLAPFNGILFNLANEIPLFYSRFDRIIEIVANNEAAKELSRQHYREYRTQQCELFTHKISAPKELHS